MKHQQIQLLIDLWKKPYGKPVVVIIVFFIVFLIVDYTYLSGENVHSNSHPFDSPVAFNVDTPDLKYRFAVSIGNEKSKYKFRYQVFNPDGDMVIDGEDAYSRNKRSFIFTPGQTGEYRLQVQSAYGSGGPPSIMVSVYKNNRSILSHKFR